MILLYIYLIGFVVCLVGALSVFKYEYSKGGIKKKDDPAAIAFFAFTWPIALIVLSYWGLKDLCKKVLK